MSKIITIRHDNRVLFSANSERIKYAVAKNNMVTVYFHDGGEEEFAHQEAEQTARDINSLL